MTARFYVLDTGYLIAYYGVRGSHGEFAEVRRRIKVARTERARLVVPWPCWYELAAHVAEDHTDKGLIRKTAIAIAADLEAAVAQQEDALFAVDAMPRPEETRRLLAVWATVGLDGSSGFAQQGFSLVDTAIVLAANQLKARDRTFLVHIWTWERKRRNLRAYSPDVEAKPFPDWVD